MESRLKLATSIHDYFAGELNRALKNQGVQPGRYAFDYLTSLFPKYMESETFFAKTEDGKLRNNFLFEIYSQTIENTGAAKIQSLTRLGDLCLLISGFFSDSLKRKLNDVDYYHGLGGSAYNELSLTSGTSQSQETFRELSENFIVFSQVFEEVSERSGLTNNQDTLRLYERWLVSKDDRLKKALNEQGIVAPVEVDRKKIH